MRNIIISIFIIYIFNNYIKELDKSINNICNKNTLNITNNKDIYNCLLVNKSNNCSYINNFINYNTINKLCIDKYNSEISSEIFSIIIICLVFYLK